MPLIRYRIGDLAVKADPNKKCSCGREFPMLEKIIGRDTDIIYTPKGKARQTYTVTAEAGKPFLQTIKIFNSKGQQVFKTPGADQIAIMTNVLVKNDAAVVVTYKENKYIFVPHGPNAIFSVKTKKQMNWAANDGMRIAITKLGEAKLAKKTENITEVGWKNCCWILQFAGASGF